MQRSQRDYVLTAKKTNTHLDLRLNWGLQAMAELLKAFAVVSPEGAQRTQQQMAADVDSLLGRMAAELSAQVEAAIEAEAIEADWHTADMIDTLLGQLTKVEATKARFEMMVAQEAARAPQFGRNARTSLTRSNSHLNGRLNYGFQGFAQIVEALAMFSPQRAQRVQQEMATHIDSLFRDVAARLSAETTAILEEREAGDSSGLETLSRLKATADSMVDRGDIGLKPPLSPSKAGIL